MGYQKVRRKNLVKESYYSSSLPPFLLPFLRHSFPCSFPLVCFLPPFLHFFLWILTTILACFLNYYLPLIYFPFFLYFFLPSPLSLTLFLPPSFLFLLIYEPSQLRKSFLPSYFQVAKQLLVLFCLKVFSVFHNNEKFDIPFQRSTFQVVLVSLSWQVET